MTALFEESSAPFACVWLTGPRAHIEALRRSGTPVFEDYAQAVRALEARRLIDEAAERAARGVPSIDPARQEKAIHLIERATASAEGMLDTETCTALLDLYDIPRAGEHIAATVEDAIAAWKKFGGSVVLKVVSDALVHKTDAGGVVLNLSTEKDIREAAKNLLALAPDARVLVQEMIAEGVELIFGISTGPTFGPCVTAGVGGIFVEALGDLSRRLPPFDETVAERMLRALRSAKVLEGLRGAPAVNMPESAAVLARVSQMASELEDQIAELDINPLIAGPNNSVAVDVRIRKS